MAIWEANAPLITFGSAVIRAGRTEEQRTGMMTKMMQDISRITGVGQEDDLAKLGTTKENFQL